MQPVRCDTQDDWERILDESPALLAFFHAPGCGICDVLKPKLQAFLVREFPRMQWAAIDIAKTPAIAARLQVHTVPTAILYFEGREHQRFSHAFGLKELGAAIRRPYALLFEVDR